MKWFGLFSAILIGTILFFLISSGYAVQEKELWTSANGAYDNGAYDAAIADYTQLLDKGLRTPAVYFNLGNAYFKTNKLGLAIASYLHCLKLDPSFGPASENLNYIRQFAVDKVEEKPKGFLLNIWYGLAGILPAQGNFVFTIIVFWSMSGVLTLWILGIGRREFLIYLLILLSVILILGIAVTYNEVSTELNTKWGVLTASSAELKEGPGGDFGKIFTGHEGLEFRILSRRQDYYLVELRNGLKGWIQMSLLTEI